MNRAFVVRASIVLGILIGLILIPVGIEAFTTKTNTPTLSNANDAYLTVDGVEITNQDLWDTMKNIDGVDYLVDYALESILARELAAVTQDEIDAEIQLLKYLTDDEEVIAEIQADEDLHQQYLDSFSQNLIVLGYDPEDADSLADFVKLSIAKENYTRALYDTDDAEADEYVDAFDVAEYYDETAKGDVCSLDIRFSNQTEVIYVFRDFNLVLNHEGGIGEYIGTEEIEEVLTFDSNNTLELSDDAVFNFYIKMYNMMNPNGTQITEGISQKDFCMNYPEIAVKNYVDMTEGVSTTSPMLTYADFIYNDLEDGEFSYTNTSAVGDFTMLSFKVSTDEVPAYDTLTTEEQAQWREDYIDTLVDETKVNATMSALLEENELEIFDRELKLKYSFTYGVEFDNKGDKEVLFSLATKDVTVDDFFAYMEGRIGVFYATEAAKAALLLDGDQFDSLYDGDHDYFNSDNELMKEHVTSLDDMKANFGTNQYAQYGYSSANMTWEEFLYLAFSLESETDVIENMFVIPTIQNEIMHEQINYEDSVAYMQDQIDRYYSLNTSHLLIYLDNDFDFVPDNYEEYTEGLTAQEVTDLNALLVEYRDLIIEKVTDEESFGDIVDAYQKALISDETNEWSKFKQAGFFIKTEELGEIDHNSGENLDQSFADSLFRIYNVYVDVNNDDLDKYNDDQLTFSEFGVHYISVTEGTFFDKYSAEFTDTDNEGDPENDSVMPNKEQVELFVEIKLAASKDENTTAMFHDSDVYDAVTYYFTEIYDSYNTQTAFSAYMGEFILDNDGTFADDNTAKRAQLELISNTLKEVTYPDLFGQDVD